MLEERKILMQLVRSALDAVKPDSAVLRHLHLKGTELQLLSTEAAVETSLDLVKLQRIFLIGAGKGAAPMAVAVEKVLKDRLTDGLIVVKYGHASEQCHVRQAEAGHPVPDANGVRASQAILNLAKSANASDLVICVLTGGASALTPAMVKGISLADLQVLTTHLLRSGASIQEINTIRKHISAFSGGKLVRAVYPATLFSLVVSDVVGDDLSSIASGPTVPDVSTYADALQLLDKYNLRSIIPANILQHLEAGNAGRIPETPKPDDPIFACGHTTLVASNKQALDAAFAEAKKLGFAPRILTSELQGEARDRAEDLVALALRTQKTLRSGDQSVCLLAGGETTVTLRGSGRGGRNQEMALASLIALQQTSGIHAVFVGTDGSDGPTDAAGGFAASNAFDHEKSKQCENLNNSTVNLTANDAKSALENNDSYAFLDQMGALLKTGPTLTNVMDIAAFLIYPN